MGFSLIELTLSCLESGCAHPISPDSSYALGLPQPPAQLHKAVIDEPPPFLGTWRRVYIFVLCSLVFVIAALYVFSRAYAP
jgi:hypothetical protein